MIDLLSARKNQKKVSVKHLLLTFLACISMVTWLGTSDLRAGEVAPGEFADETEVAESNEAQSQRLRNVAEEAASQDPDTNEGNYEQKVAMYTEQIEAWRLDDMGWGYIVKKLNRDYDLNIHPSVLGLGHSKKSSEETVQSSQYRNTQSGNSQGQGLALGHSKDNSSSNRGGGNGGGKGGGKK